MDSFVDVGLSGGMLTTLMVSIERYLGICQPFSKRKRNTWIYVISLLAFTICLNLPQMFEYGYGFENRTVVFTPRPWNNEKYRTIYHLWMKTVMVQLVPIPIMIVLNLAVIRAVRKSSINCGIVEVSNQAYDRRVTSEVTKTLLIVVAIFLLSRIFFFVTNMLYNAGPTSDEFRKKWYFLLPIQDFLLVVNSSVNFVIYCLVGKKFRRAFFDLFWRGREAIRTYTGPVTFNLTKVNTLDG